MRQRTKHPATELTGSRLKLLRENAGITLRELANLSKIDFTYIKKLELGISDPSICTLDTLLRAMDLDLQDFFDIGYKQMFLKMTEESDWK